MKPNEQRVLDYRKSRYLEHISQELLVDRLRYLIENLVTLELNGKIGMGDVRREPWKNLIVKFTHVQDELSLRGESLPANFLSGCAIPKPMIGLSERLIEINRIASVKKPHLIKFGKKEYFRKNSLKVSLASSFIDPSLNVAQMDDEMKAVFHANPKETLITASNGERIEPIGTVDFTYEIERDYYVFCSSSVFDVRMFSNFDADSCLFIYDSQRFADELISELRKNIDIEDYAYQMVEYVDPVLPHTHKPIIEFYKHLRYQYQQEYRHVIIPNSTSPKPKDIYLSLKSMVEYSELICL
ncbi:TPA: hypothetical protein ACHCBX_003361 [Vibrio parahaemolyticus]|nr:hypothetical protein [Vibrio parahaemolyticus]EIB6494438.1 hypothetical protein [Vibrio parahaemolyticus]EII2385423.1 hypothetical protein [Vibrio parahaemolyticus]EII3016314.1 hypothetical protein [Vibrio parahaemolyticus]EII5692679.1 hypothetical protein [Vibrio parahaemolyticus]EIJ2985332.1 hypothetical protein [Vibrio parahaemolyticus]